MENRADYHADNPHAHSHDDDTGVPFWKRAAVTEGQYAALLRELREVKAERDALKDELSAIKVDMMADEYIEAEAMYVGEPNVIAQYQELVAELETERDALKAQLEYAKAHTPGLAT